MKLTTGFYYVSTIATSPWGERWVQRDTVEDKTLLPKPVNVQVDEAGAGQVGDLITPTPTHSPVATPPLTKSPLPRQWYAAEVGDTGVFTLAAGSVDANPAPTIDQDGKLVADVSGSTPTNWTVTQCETCDDGIFMYVVLVPHV